MPTTLIIAVLNDQNSVLAIKLGSFASWNLSRGRLVIFQFGRSPGRCLKVGSLSDYRDELCYWTEKRETVGSYYGNGFEAFSNLFIKYGRQTDDATNEE